MKSRTFLAARNKQRGNSLFEILLVVAILGILVGIAVRYFGNASEGVKSKEASENLTALATATRSAFYSQGDYTGLANIVMSKSPALPASMKVPANLNHIKHPWRTDGVTLAPATLTSTNDAFTMTWVDVPEAACIGLGQQTYRTYTSLTVGGSVIANVADVATRCTGASNTMVWTIR